MNTKALDLKTFNKKDYSVIPIDKNTTKVFITTWHYLHSIGPYIKSFGLFDKTNTLVGVVVYGKTPNINPIKLKDNNYKSEILVLTRLCILPNQPKNAASFLIANSLKLLDKKLIITYADPVHNHTGTVYKACNAIYLGLTKHYRQPCVKGMEDVQFHKWGYGYTIQELREFWGDKLYYRTIPGKHKYLFINTKSKKEKKYIQSIIV